MGWHKEKRLSSVCVWCCKLSLKLLRRQIQNVKFKICKITFGLLHTFENRYWIVNNMDCQLQGKLFFFYYFTPETMSDNVLCLRLKIYFSYISLQVLHRVACHEWVRKLAMTVYVTWYCSLWGTFWKGNRYWFDNRN